MALYLKDGAQAYPITLAEAKQHCRIDLDDDDNLLQIYIAAATRYIERETRLSLLTETWVMAIDRFPSQGMAWNPYNWQFYWLPVRTQPYLPNGGVIFVPKPPLQRVLQISYQDTDAVWQTLDQAQYYVDAISQPGRITLVADKTWPGTAAVPNAVQIEFTSGFPATNAPDLTELRLAILLMVGHFYENREATAEKVPMPLEMAVKALVWHNKIVEFA